MNTIVEHFVTAQNPILGISPSNIAQALDTDNWQSKALLHKQPQATHYIYLNQATSAKQRQRNYCVNIYDVGSCSMVSQAVFKTVREALVFANQDGANNAFNKKA